MNLGHNRRVLVDPIAPIKAPMAGDNVTAAVTVASYYTKEHLDGVDVEWSVNGKHIMTIPADSGGVSTFSHRVSLQDNNITATFQSPYDGVPIEKEFEMTVYEKSPWTEAILTVNGKLINWNEEIVLLRGKSNQFSVEVGPEIAESLQLELVEDGGLSVAASPAFGTWNDPDGKEYSWEITPATKSGHIKLVLVSTKVTAHWELACRVLSADLADEGDVEIGGVPVSAQGNLFFRDIAQTVTLVPKAGSPLAGLPVSLKCVVKGNLDPGHVISAPAFDSYQTDHSWSITGSTQSGTFELSLAGESIPNPITLAISKLVSTDFADEVKVMRDGTAMSPDGEYFIGGVPYKFTFDYKNGDVLKDVPLVMEVIPVTDLGKNDFQSDPPLGHTSTAHVWSVTPADKAGTFKIKFATPAGEAGLVSPVNHLVVKPNVTFGFVDILYNPLPLPPASTPVISNVPYFAGVKLKSADGGDMKDVPVTFHIPEHDISTVETGATGGANAPFVVRFKTPGKRTLRAVAAFFPGIEVSAELLIEVG